MNPQDAIDFSREAIKTCMMIGGPVLLASLIIGLLVGVFQAMTQVQDQTVSFVPKILLLIVTISLMLPWCTDHLLDFAKLSFEKPMTNWSNTPIESSPPPSENQVASTAPKSQIRIAKASFPVNLPPNPARQPGANVPATIQNSSDQSSMPTMKNSDTTTTSMPTLQPRPEFKFGLEPNESGTTSPFKLPRFQQEPRTPSNDSNG